ncbi:MAG: hypothetical protein H6Q76_1470 [Firmicutes bacterium]|nr:hypothetical protein [Bacillota bacterium]
MMMAESVIKSIVYFDGEGRDYLQQTVDLVAKRLQEGDIRHVVVFTAEGEGAELLRDTLIGNKEIKILAATFPPGQKIVKREPDGNKKDIETLVSMPERIKKLESDGISVISGGMPFQEIIVPGTNDFRIQTIVWTLGLISEGLHLGIQAVLMACDSGKLAVGEKVVAMSADTAVVVQSSTSRLMFHPRDGIRIHEILCKPGYQKKDNAI